MKLDSDNEKSKDMITHLIQHTNVTASRMDRQTVLQAGKNGSTATRVTSY